MQTNPSAALMPTRSKITWRSILVGSLVALSASVLTPFNDYVVANTFLVGSYLPLIIVLSVFVLVVLINATLHRTAPARAFRTQELAVVLLMGLVACSLPSQGLLRGFIPTLVAPFQLGQSNQVFWKAFVEMHLPGFLFPVEDVASGRGSDVVGYFYSRVPPGQPLPLTAWVVPLAGWGVFIAGMLATLVSLGWLVRAQWAENERLPFPLAQIQFSLIESPAPGRCLNPLFGSRAFWIAALLVLAVHSTAALHQYFPKWPAISLSYDFSQIFSEEPWIWIPRPIKRATVYFTFVGLAYFIQSRTAFSMWAVFFLMQLAAIEQKWVAGFDMTMAAWRDQHLGAAIVYFAGFLWVGRFYWLALVRGRTVHHRGALLIALAGVLLMLSWLIAMKVSPWMAALIVFFILLPHLVTTRLVAETGMCFIRSVTTPAQILTTLPSASMSGRDVFFAGVFSINGAPTTRESLMTFSQHGLRVCDQANVDVARQRLKVAGVIAWTLLLTFTAASCSSLWCYYTYATPLSQPLTGDQPVINPDALITAPTNEIVEPMSRHAEGKFAAKTHNPYLHWGIGAGATALLQLASWQFSWWPLVPVGYVIGTAQFIQTAWFSLLLGWLAKVLIVRFGGAELFKRSRPVFIGVIFGEALAAGLWLVVNLTLAWAGLDYQPVRLLPT